MNTPTLLTESVARSIAVFFLRLSAAPSGVTLDGLKLLGSLHPGVGDFIVGLEDREAFLTQFARAQDGAGISTDVPESGSEWDLMVKAVASTRTWKTPWFNRVTLDRIARLIRFGACNLTIKAVSAGESTADIQKAFFASPVFEDVITATRIALGGASPEGLGKLSLQPAEIRRILCHFNAHGLAPALFFKMDEAGVRTIFALQSRLTGLFSDDGTPIEDLTHYPEVEIRAVSGMISEWMIGETPASARSLHVSDSVREVAIQTLVLLDNEELARTGNRFKRVPPKEESLVRSALLSIVFLVVWMGTVILVVRSCQGPRKAVRPEGGVTPAAQVQH